MDSLIHQFERISAVEKGLSLAEDEFSPPAEWAEYLSNETLAQPSQLLVSFAGSFTRADFALQLALRLAVSVSQHALLDEQVLRKMAPLWLVFACHSLRDWSVWQISRHPLRLLLEQILIISRSYQETEHPASKQYLQHLHTRLFNLARVSLRHNTLEASLPALKSVIDLLQHVKDQQREADRRTLEQMAQNARSTHAHTEVSRTIRQAVLGQPISALIVDFLDQHWRKYLYTVYLREGMESNTWRQGLSDLQLMIDIASFLTPEDLKAQRKQTIAPLQKRIENALAQIHLPPGAALSFMQEFSDLISARERNAPDAGLPLGELPEDENAYANSAHVVIDDRTVLAGQVVFLNQAQQQRARIIDVDLSQDKILFADFTGQLLATLNHQALAQWRERGDIQPIPEINIFDYLALELPSVLEQYLAQGEERVQQRKRAHRVKREAEIAADIEKRKQQEATQRAQKIELAKAARSAEQKKLRALAKITALRSGALVKLALDAQTLRPCYLAMINEQQQYVFVDRQGKKIAELSREALVELWSKDQLLITESGSALDSALSGLIKERRNFLNEDEP